MAGFDQLLFASGNQHKIRELQQILLPFSIHITTPADIGGLPDVIEDGDTFAANAIKKACAGLAHSGMPTLADDSGIEARALNWRPGVYSARYAGPACDDAANNQKLIEELSDKDDKFVQYRCVIALARPDAEPLTWEGTFAGEHTAKARGTAGFGYDPHVYLSALGKTVAELTDEEKHQRSHRGIALRAFVSWLQQQA
jgi:XTP/dITP diphosphohydrolase